MDRYERAFMTYLKVTTVGNSLGVILPKDILAKLKVSKNDRLYAIETHDGIELTPYDPEFAEQMDVAKKIMRRERDVLKKLSK